MTDKPILEVRDLEVAFHVRAGTTHAVNGISYTLHEGETLGIAGESGCGKTVSSMALLKLISIPPGKIEKGSAIYRGKTDLIPLSSRQLRPFRGREIGVIFQDPMTAFNQVMTVGEQMCEGYMTHFRATRKEAMKEAERLMEMTGVPSPAARLREYPNQFSGGMRQRAMIAMALMCRPGVLIADEPTTALDVTIQGQILDLMKNLRRELGTAIMWVSHDLAVIAGLADTVNIMYAGQIVETASVDELYAHPLHPYTRGLLASLPSAERRAEEGRRLHAIPGFPPVLDRPVTGCPFARRCAEASEQCFRECPVLRDTGKRHLAACHLV